METQTEKPQVKILIRNLGQGTHIFGAAFVHPTGNDGKPDDKAQAVCKCPIMELGPKGSAKDRVELSPEQFHFYDDALMRAKVESREYAIYVDGRDLRPDLARKEAPVAGGPSTATESNATVESSVLAEIMAEGEPKAE